MMIIVDAFRRGDKDYEYAMFDQYTNSCRRAGEEEVMNLMERGIGFSNIQENFGSLYIDNGYNRVERFSSDGKIRVVSANICDKQFKITSAYGHVQYVDIKELAEMANSNILYNCRINSGELEFIDKCILKTTREFKDSIDDKYNKFIAKSKMVGLDGRFEYSVEGDNIILAQYKGESERFIVPSFITSISSEAFQYSYMESIELNNGLKYIGANAFRASSIRAIEIPETVKYIGQYAFAGNPGLMKIYNSNNNKINVINNELVKMSRNTISFDNEIEVGK